MVKVLAAEHVRDMLVRAERTQRVNEARHARKAFRASRTVPASTVPASTDPVTPQSGRRTQCPQSVMEH
jgi:hypothetical protein